jgi:glucose dehydrogenase
MRHSAFIVIVSAVCSFLWTGAATAGASCDGTAPGGDWPSFGHDLANTRNQDQEQTITPARASTLAPVWTFSSSAAGGSGDFAGTPVEANGCVYVGSSSGCIFALNANTGDVVWKTPSPLPGGISQSLAVGSEGRVFAHVARSGAPLVAAFDATNGHSAVGDNSQR